MKTTSYQLTIRGVDSRTKQLLSKKAALKGMSLNKLVLQSLHQTAGTDPEQERYAAMKHLLSQNRMSKADKAAFDEAITWLDKASLEKQKRDEKL
jgi:uncharacterized protein (DUF1778 family)